MSDPIRLDVFDEIPLSTLYREREDARLEGQQRLMMGLELDISEAGTAKSADAAAKAQQPPETDWQTVIEQGIGRVRLRQMGGMPRPVTPAEATQAKEALAGAPSATTPARQPINFEDAVATLKAQPTAREMADRVLRLLTGDQIGFDDLTPEGIARNAIDGKRIDPLKLLDPAGNTVEELAKRHAKSTGASDEIADQVGAIGGVLAGFYLPFFGGKGKALKAGAKAVGGQGGATIRLYRGEGSVKVTDGPGGRWFTPELNAAKGFAGREGRIVYVDVPSDVATASQVKVTGGSSAFKRHLLPPEWATQATEWDAAIGEKVGINLARVDAAVEVKSTMGAISQLQAERLAQARKTVTHSQTIAEGQRLNLTLEQAAALDVEKYALAPIQNALRDYHNAAAAHTDDLMRRTLRGGADADDAAVALNYAWVVAGDLSVRDELLGKVAARGLEARKIKSLAERAPFSPEQIIAMTDLMGGAVPTTRAELIERGKTLARRLTILSKEQRREFERMAVTEARAGKTNVLYEAWLNWGLLSGPQTHAANVASNALTALWAPEQRMLAALADTVITGGGAWGERSVYFGESAAMMYGMTRAISEARQLALKALVTGKSEFGPDKVEFGLDAARRVFTQGDDAASDAIGLWGAVFRGPTRALTAEDAFFKTINFRGELYAQAYREAAAKRLHGEAFWKEVARVIKTPPAIVDERARQFALTNTFNREVQDLGWIGVAGGKMLGGVRAIPIIGPLSVPFLRTPVNLAHVASEYTPFLNAFSDTLRADIIAGGARRAEALAKITSGALLGWGVMEYAAAGLITGAGPSNPNERAMWEAQDGRKPYSIRLFGQWIGYNRVDPIGLMMGTVATAMEVMTRLPEGSPYRAEIAAAISLAFARGMVSKTWLEGLHRLDETIHNPDRHLLDIPKGLASTLVPSFLRTIERVTDPTRRETRVPREVFNEATGMFENNPWAEVQELVNAAIAVTPGMSTTLSPFRNRFGEVVLIPPGIGPDWLSPIYSSVVKDDPVAKELARLRVGLSLPPPVVFGRQPPMLELAGGREEEHGVELNDAETDRLRVLAGQGGASPKVGNVDLGEMAEMPTFREALRAAMAGQEYREAGDAGKRLIVRRLDEGYKKAARGQLLRESSGLVGLIEAKLRQREQALTGKPTGANLAPSLGR